MTELRIDDFKSIIHRIKNIIDHNREFLGELDSIMGDGDLGFTMTKAFSAAEQEADKSEERIPGKLLFRLGMIIAKASPSTMGTLIATGFMKGGKSIELCEQVGPQELSIFFEVFVKSIME